MGLTLSKTNSTQNSSTKLPPSKNKNSSSISSSITSSSSVQLESPVHNQKMHPPKTMETIEFQWAGKAKEVFLTGSFSKWSTQFVMFETQKGKFEITLNLLPGEYEYKYLVDGVWKVDDIRPVLTDNKGKEKNYLLVTSTNPLEISKLTFPKINKSKTAKSKEEKIYFDINIKSKPTKCPSSFNRDIINKKSNCFLNENMACMNFDNTHLYTTLNHFYRPEFVNNKRCIKLSSGLRVNQKFVTFCYYKPWKMKE